MILVAVYVDDILVASRNIEKIEKIYEQLSKVFEIKSLVKIIKILSRNRIYTKQGMNKHESEGIHK